MHLHLHLPRTMIIIAAATILTLLIYAPTPSRALDAQFLACNTTFNCGNISGIGYPFWTVNREPYCGYPGTEFQLACAGAAAEITISQQTYKILQIHGDDKSLTVARKDYPSSLCLTSNASLDFTLFDYTSDSANLTLFSGCTDLYSERIDLDPAEVSCGDSSYGYYATAGNGVYDYLGGAGCARRVVVPFNKSSFPNTGSSVVTIENVGAAIENGFGVNWYARNEACDACVRSGGACGHSSTSGSFACYCADKPYTKTCGGGGKPVSLIIGIAIGGAGIVGIMLGLGAFFLIQRRRRIAAQSVSKDLSVPTGSTPSSKGLATSTTYFSRSNPSNLSSRSDLEKGSTYFGVQVFSYTELEEATDSFDSSKELGDGGFGVVYYGVLHDGRVVAVKRLFENNFKRVEQFMNEVEILTRLRHQHLVTLYGCTSRRSRELLLVYEYISNGTVADHLHGKQAKSGLLSWPIRLKIAVETANALAYLHNSDIIHRDVKTNNILLDINFCVKVADFGLSRLFPNDVTHVSTAPQGTPGYVDPEYYQCYQLTNKSDVYSFGVVLTELLSSKQAVDITRHRHDINLANMAVNKIQNHSLHELVDPSIGFERDYNVRRMVTSVAELAFRCLQQERDMRPSMDEVLEVLRGIQSEEVKEQEVEIVDIEADDAGILKSNPPPLSPDSVATDKWVSSSTATNSF